MKRSAGFTLIEVLVAVTLLAVVVTLAMGGLRLGARSWGTGNERLERVGAFHSSYRFLRQSLSQAYPAVIGDVGDVRFAFAGNDRELIFVVNRSPRAGLSGPQVIALRVARGREGQELRVVLAPFRPDADVLAARAQRPEDEGVLISEASAISLSYFGARRPGDPLRWQSVWDAPHNMPRLVRLAVIQTGAAWPEMVFPVAITIDADCAIFSQSELRMCRLDEEVRR